MRVIAGIAKGRKLKYPRGSTLRPSSAKVRGAIFSMLASADADMRIVLDLYAGTGSFGIEAMSRGAEWVDFVEKEHRHCSTIRSNLDILGMSASANVHCQSVEYALKSLDCVYGVVFLDPPYSIGKLDSVMHQLATSPVNNKNTIIVVEHSVRHTMTEAYGKFRLGRARRYGETSVSMYQQEVHP